MTSENMLEELKESLDRNQEAYIYGAARTAGRVYDFLAELELESRVKGFVVTDMENNPKSLKCLPVISIYKIQNKKAVLIVPHLGTYKEEIQVLLRKLNFQNVCYINKYMSMQKKADEQYVEFERAQIEKWRNGKSLEERENDKKLRDEISEILKKSQPDFGQGNFYQSFERLGIEGERFTVYRLERYGIDNILRQCSSPVSILDIGCNVGFLDMEISAQQASQEALSILGVEYDSSLVEIAKNVCNYLKLENCDFVNSDFKEWVKGNTSKFDLIFSFAIHHWLDLSSNMYVEIVDSLLNEKGFICFESHDLQSGDDKYEVCKKLFVEKRYKILNESHIKDDGIVDREFCILQK